VFSGKFLTGNYVSGEDSTSIGCFLARFRLTLKFSIRVGVLVEF
jgi:hypothetical protein